MVGRCWDIEMMIFFILGRTSSLFKNLVGVLCVFLPSSTLRAFGWWWMVVAWFSLPLFSRKWDVKPTTGLFGTTFRPGGRGEISAFLRESSILLASPTPFFREYEKYSWIWDCQNIYIYIGRQWCTCKLRPSIHCQAWSGQTRCC